MGTRNSTLVKLNGEFKVAQYGQWDGYPDGQGVTILNIMRGCDLNKFRDNVSKLTEISPKKLKQLWKEAGADDSEWVSMDVAERFKTKYPFYSRDCGGEILKYVLNGECTEMNLNVEFAQSDGTFCEWSYIVNLDTNKLECYSGTINQAYLVVEFDLENLPNEEEFLTAFKTEEEDEF